MGVPASVPAGVLFVELPYVLRPNVPRITRRGRAACLGRLPVRVCSVQAHLPVRRFSANRSLKGNLTGCSDIPF